VISKQKELFMRSHCVKFHRLYTSLFLFSLLFFIVGCTSAWTSQASSILTVLEAAVPSLLAILSAFGVGLPTESLTKIQAWGADASAAFLQVKTLIDEYNTAEATAKPGLLTEIQSALAVVTSNLKALLPDLNVVNQTNQAKIIAVFTAVSSELDALIGLVPVLQGTVTSHEELKALLNSLKSAKEFKADYNEKAAIFGETYQIK